MNFGRDAIDDVYRLGFATTVDPVRRSVARSWSPDGTQLAFLKNGTVSILDIASDIVTELGGARSDIATSLSWRGIETPSIQAEVIFEPSRHEEMDKYEIFNTYESVTPGERGEARILIASNQPLVTLAVDAAGRSVYAAVTDGEDSTVKIDARSTAEALLRLNPFLIGTTEDQFSIVEAIRDSPALDGIASILDRNYLNGTNPFADADLETAVVAAVVAILESLSGGSISTTTGDGSRAGSIAPSQCQRTADLAVCNRDMVALTLEDSVSPVLRLRPVTFGALQVSNNVDWVVRIVELDPTRIQASGTADRDLIFHPDSLDDKIMVGGYDRKLIVEGQVASGLFGFVVDPLGTVAGFLAGAVYPDSGVQLPSGVYGVIAYSGSWNDSTELAAIGDSEWQSNFWVEALAVNSLNVIRDVLGAAGINVNGVSISVYTTAILPGFKAAINANPVLSAEDVSRILRVGIDRAAEQLPRLLHRGIRAHASEGWRALLHFGVNKMSAVARAIPGGVKVTSRVGSLAGAVTAREAGWVIRSSCGNGQREGIEQCDGTDLGATTCAERGFDCGELDCKSDCAVETSGCVQNSCSLPGSQQCLGDTVHRCEDYDGNGCIEWGLYQNCPKGCTNGACIQDDPCLANCGNGSIEAACSEQCEGDNFNGQTCLSEGFCGGALSCNGCRISTAGCSACPNTPNAPIAGNGAPLSFRSTLVSWQDNNPAGSIQSVEIWRRTGSAGTYSLIATHSAGQGGFADNGPLSGGQQYFYKFRAVAGGQHSAFSEEVQVTTLACLEVSNSGLGANVRNGPGTSCGTCELLLTLQDGTQISTFGCGSVADGHTWCSMTSYVTSGNLVSLTGWLSQESLGPCH